jgi:hypothetical protein
MASNETWKKLKYFSKDGPDNWGDADAMDDNLLLALDDFRAFIGVPILVLHGNGGKHSAKSFHYIKNGSCAVDVIIPDYPRSAIDLLLDVFRFPFTGVGYYPEWKFNGKRTFGLHLDARPLKWDSDFTLNYKESRWIGVYQKAYADGQMIKRQIYLPMTYENIKKYSEESWLLG